MELESLRAFYIDELEDLYSAEGQILKALTRMIGAASSLELQKALSEHERATRSQVRRLERIFKDLDDIPSDNRSS